MTIFNKILKQKNLTSRKKEDGGFSFKTYGASELSKVYKQHAKNPLSVEYSIDNGITWQVVDSVRGKWDTLNSIFRIVK